uniref:BCCT family transporter n=1 Tax=Siminovitchia fortis TaxID=254758 RepID=UPI00164359BD
GEKGEMSRRLNRVLGKSGKGGIGKRMNIVGVIGRVMGVGTWVGLGMLEMNGGVEYLLSMG